MNTPADSVSNLHVLSAMVARNDLTFEQFYHAVNLELGLTERSERSKAIGKMVTDVSDGALPLSALLAVLEDGS